MGAPNQPRQRRKRHTRRDKGANFFKRMWSTPEGRAKMEAWRRSGIHKGGRPMFATDGADPKETEVLLTRAQSDAERIVKIMDEEKLIPEPTDELLGNDKDMAKEALKATIVILRMPGQKSERLAAARTILEYTRSKPAQSSNVTVSTAEDFLAGLLAKDKVQGK